MNLIDLTNIKTDDPGFNHARQEFQAARTAHAGAIARVCVADTPETRESITAARKRSVQAAQALQDARYRLAAALIHDIVTIVPGSLVETPADDHTR